MSCKSAKALEFSIDKVCSKGVAYFWTFTFADLHDVPDACKRWQGACRDLVELVGFTGVRVYELHEFHGLHIHAIVVGRYHLARVRNIVRTYGFGRVHVQRVQKNPYYIAKYVSKEERAPCLAGRRLWATFGGKTEWTTNKEVRTGKALVGALVKTRVKDIAIDSLLARSSLFVAVEFPHIKGLKRFQAAAWIGHLAIQAGDDLRGNCNALRSLILDGFYWRFAPPCCASEAATGSGEAANNLVKNETIPDRSKPSIKAA